MPFTLTPTSPHAQRQVEQISAAANALPLVAVEASGPELDASAVALLRTAASPVLIARRPPHGAFGRSVLVAVDADPSCRDAAEVAAQVAAAAGGRVAIVASPAHDARTRDVLAAAAGRVRELLDVDPIVLDENASPARAVAAAAATVEASLVVTGSRGPGVADSVSERIAQTAPCSVLVMRAPRRCG